MKLPELPGQESKRRLPQRGVKEAQTVQDDSEDMEWWEQFGDCYDYWPSFPESEFDYLYWGLVRKTRT